MPSRRLTAAKARPALKGFFPAKQVNFQQLKGGFAMAEDILSHARLKELLCYCPETGVFTRLVTTSSNAIAGSVAGSLNKNSRYLYISLDKKKYLAHRLAWFYVHGVWPHACIDHINRHGTDNRISNLRVAKHCENGQNLSLSRNNKSGHQGVYWNEATSKWQAQIMVNRKCIYIGRFANLDDAVAARNKAKSTMHTFVN